jgi:hypothetical protein
MDQYFLKQQHRGLNATSWNGTLNCTERQVYSPFGDTELGRHLGPFGSSPLATQRLEGTFQHEKKSIRAIASQLKRRTDIPPMPQPTGTEQEFSNACGGLHEASSIPPSGLYNALYKCLSSKKQDDSSYPARLSLFCMMEIPMICTYTSPYSPQVCHT